MTGLLNDQFHQLNEDFGKCIDGAGEFTGNLEQFRGRHQAISRSVREADRFLMMSNGANCCCQVATIIVVLYSAIFHRDDTISLDLESAEVYISWLCFSLFSLSLAAGQAILLNHTASVHRYDCNVNKQPVGCDAQLPSRGNCPLGMSRGNF